MKKALSILLLALCLCVPVVAQAGGLNVNAILPIDTAPYVVTTVYNSSGAGVTLGTGDVVIWDTADTTRYGVAVTTTTVADDKKVAGVIVGANIANGAYGTMLVYGVHTGIKVANDPAVGVNLGCSDTVKVSTTTVTANVSFATVLAKNNPVTTCIGFVRCLGR